MINMEQYTTVASSSTNSSLVSATANCQNRTGLQLWPDLVVVNNPTQDGIQYKCSFCEERFESEVFLRNHLKKHNPTLSVDSVTEAVASCSGNRSSQRPTSLSQPSSVQQVITTVEQCSGSFMCATCKETVNSVGSAELHACNSFDSMKCSECDRVAISNVGELWLHVKRIHPHRNIFECALCAKGTYPLIEGLIRHLVNLHSDSYGLKCFSCLKCSRGVTLLSMEIHNYTCVAADIGLARSPENTCSKCNMSFSSDLELKQHMLLRYMCRLCLEKFPTIEKLGTHMVKHVAMGNVVECNGDAETTFIKCACGKQCGREQVDAMKRHQLFRHIGKVFLCVRCGSHRHKVTHGWLSEGEFFLHHRFCGTCHMHICSRSKYVGEDIPSNCPKCDIPLATNLESILLQKPLDMLECFGCASCNATFATHCKLTAHLPLCTKYKYDDRFECQFCKKSYWQAASLSDHLCMEHPDKGTELVCKCCKNSFDNPSQLSTHMEEHGYITKPYKCSFCQMTFTTIYSLKDHVKLHAKSVFTCTKCPARYSSHNAVLQHFNDAHSQQKFITLNQLLRSREDTTKDNSELKDTATYQGNIKPRAVSEHKDASRLHREENKSRTAANGVLRQLLTSSQKHTEIITLESSSSEPSEIVSEIQSEMIEIPLKRSRTESQEAVGWSNEEQEGDGPEIYVDNFELHCNGSPSSPLTYSSINVPSSPCNSHTGTSSANELRSLRELSVCSDSVIQQPATFSAANSRPQSVGLLSASKTRTGLNYLNNISIKSLLETPKPASSLAELLQEPPQDQLVMSESADSVHKKELPVNEAEYIADALFTNTQSLSEDGPEISNTLAKHQLSSSLSVEHRDNISTGNESPSISRPIIHTNINTTAKNHGNEPATKSSDIWPVLCGWIEFFGGEQLMNDLNICSSCQFVCKTDTYRALHDKHHSSRYELQCVTCSIKFANNIDFHQHLVENHL